MKNNEKKFRPSIKFLYRYYIDYSLVIMLFILPWFIPISLLFPPHKSVWITFPTIFFLWFVWYWIPKYYKSIEYNLTDKEIIWNRGVWFKKSTRIHYNRITDLKISQGPISRKLGIYTISIHTAGRGTPIPEMFIFGVEKPNELIHEIEKRMGKPKAVEVFEEDVQTEILKELRKIRKLLEKHDQGSK